MNSLMILLACLAFASTVYANGCSRDFCQNGGVCYDFGLGPQCNCRDFFGGDRCEVNPCSPNPCVKGQGFCYPLDWGVGGCICFSGYTGENCQTVN